MVKPLYFVMNLHGGEYTGGDIPCDSHNLHSAIGEALDFFSEFRTGVIEVREYDGKSVFNLNAGTYEISAEACENHADYGLC